MYLLSVSRIQIHGGFYVNTRTYPLSQNGDKYRLFCIAVRYLCKRFEQWNAMAQSIVSIVFLILGQSTFKKLERVRNTSFPRVKMKSTSANNFFEAIVTI